MKKLLTLIFIFISLYCSAQKHYNNKKQHIYDINYSLGFGTNTNMYCATFTHTKVIYYHNFNYVGIGFGEQFYQSYSNNEYKLNTPVFLSYKYLTHDKFNPDKICGVAQLNLGYSFNQNKSNSSIYLNPEIGFNIKHFTGLLGVTTVNKNYLLNIKFCYNL